jgi:hypothetical protein
MGAHGVHFPFFANPLFLPFFCFFVFLVFLRFFAFLGLMGSFEKHKEDRRGNNYFFLIWFLILWPFFGRGTQAKCIPSSAGSGAGIGLRGRFSSFSSRPRRCIFLTSQLIGAD